jgi:hypothetical protein
MVLKAESVRCDLDLAREWQSRWLTSKSDVFYSSISYSGSNIVKERALYTSMPYYNAIDLTVFRE